MSKQLEAKHAVEGAEKLPKPAVEESDIVAVERWDDWSIEIDVPHFDNSARVLSLWKHR